MTSTRRNSAKKISKKELDEKIKRTTHDRALVRVGKRGITNSLLEEVIRHVEKRYVVKVKVLQSIEDYRATLNEIATRTDLELIKKVGRTGIFCQKQLLS